MKALLYALTLVLAGSFVLGSLQPAYAQTQTGDNPLQVLEKTGLGGDGAEDASKRLPVIVGDIIKALLSLLGIIFVVLMLYAGFLWMTARGESDKVEKAKDTIKNAIIGIILVVLAYAITGFVVGAVLRAGGNQ